ncbi:6938_t:CDS:2 [Gigaspora rosea]|nr:6938_t:CDS:2 [Gigaspora rosea]
MAIPKTYIENICYITNSTAIPKTYIETYLKKKDISSRRNYDGTNDGDFDWHQ